MMISECKRVLLNNWKGSLKEITKKYNGGDESMLDISPYFVQLEAWT